jgi:hypothetical protein
VNASSIVHLPSAIPQPELPLANEQRLPIAGRQIGWGEIELRGHRHFHGCISEVQIGGIGFIHIQSILPGIASSRQFFFRADELMAIRISTEADLRAVLETFTCDMLHVQEMVSGYFGLNRETMISKQKNPGCRKERLTIPRMIAMRLCRELGYSYSAIGEAFNRDHGTIIHAFNRIGNLFDTDKTVRLAMTRLREDLRLSPKKQICNPQSAI